MSDVWASAALRDGLISLGDVWRHAGKHPCDGLVVLSTPDGAVIYRSDQPVPAIVPVSSNPGTRGRTLHIGPGVGLTEVGAFIGSLPADIRPANYTVAPGVTR
jgi:hypothetical protein